MPGTLCEGETLEALHKIQGLPVEALIGPTATEARVADIASPKVFHIATHGFYEGAAKQNLKSRNTGMKLSSLNSRDLEQAPFNPNEWLDDQRPMLASGLALAGANGVVKGRVAGDYTDGILSALEVLSMDLRGTDLVVLSACETGLGDISKADGVYSLNRAFLEAGAKNVLSTLWAVDDEATAAFMEYFYTLYLRGHTPREALRFTQLHFIHDTPWNHPYYWAPFVLVGGK
ncbi:MAG: CHAT domain-containing protein [Acidobacteriota bacterium]|nr:CHAT domain-containing protein [Acidobacteriota bacterium]